MTTTELLLPTWKTDEESLVGLKVNQHVLADTFGNIEGLKFAFLGRLIEENGRPVENPASKSLLVLGTFLPGKSPELGS